VPIVFASFTTRSRRAVAVVIALIFDLADPRRGLIRITQEPLVDLQKTIQAPPG
jgi:hypothetical protein